MLVELNVVTTFSAFLKSLAGRRPERLDSWALLGPVCLSPTLALVWGTLICVGVGGGIS